MSATNIEPKIESSIEEEEILNDFTITVATKNGSGSQTSNSLLVRALFNMGIPVNGKNMFPSNIKGLPTWFTIRASKDGYVARRAVSEILIAYNETTAAEDISKVPPGGVCILPAEWKWTQSREDIHYYEVPVKALMKQVDVPSELRTRMENMTYVGAVAALFCIPHDEIHTALMTIFGGKEKVVQLNMSVVELAFHWVNENVEKRDKYCFCDMESTQGKIIITGNEAAAIGSIFGGMNVAAWYPITPSTSVIDGVISFKKLRRDPDTGKSMVAVIQAEDELAAMGMIIGAGWAGARAMTATSGPGISLMAEFAGLAYFAEIPCVIWDVTRMGPSTGMPTRTSQGDLLFTYLLGHGDTHHLCLLPASPEEIFEFGWRSFDIAEEIQTPVFVIIDLDLGMNNWMSEPFDYPDEPVKRGKVLDEKQLQAFIEEHGKWGRYMDVDGDGVTYRTLPGTDHPMAAYFTRGTGHNEMAVYSERSDDWVENMTRIRKKIMETSLKVLPEPIVDTTQGADIGLITFGSNEPAIQEARDKLAATGMATDYLRVRALPMHEQVSAFIHSHKTVYVIENNFDGQLHQIICMEHPEDITHVKSLALGDGLPMTPDWVIEQITEMEVK